MEFHVWEISDKFVTEYTDIVVIVSCAGHKRISSKVERYNPLTDQWEARRSLLTPRFFALLASVGNKLFLIGGATLDNTGSVVCVPKVSPRAFFKGEKIPSL